MYSFDVFLLEIAIQRSHDKIIGSYCSKCLHQINIIPRSIFKMYHLAFKIMCYACPVLVSLVTNGYNDSVLCKVNQKCEKTKLR